MSTPDDRPPSYSPLAEETTAADTTINEPESDTAANDKHEKPTHATTAGSSGAGDDLKAARAELAALQAEHRSLKTSEHELRQRKGAPAAATRSTTATSQQQRPGTEGVPVHVVAMLCMLCMTCRCTC